MRQGGLILMMLIVTGTTQASEATDQLLQQYRAQGAGPFSQQAGRVIWYGTHISDQVPRRRSCTDCHGQNLTDSGTHLSTGKTIAPISPQINSGRLTQSKKISKWLLRNCKWTLGRECSVQERGDLLTFLQDAQ